MSLPANLKATTEQDLLTLIQNKTAESSTLDFKSRINPFNDKEKHELAADVSSFANASGGEIIYGISEDDDGFAASLEHLSLNPSNTPLEMQKIIDSNIEPKVQGIQIQPIETEKGYALVIRIPQSPAAPHRVKTNHRFYVRASTGKREMDMTEITNCVLHSKSKFDNCTNFHSDRVKKIQENDDPMPHAEGPALVVHLVPMQALHNLMTVEPKEHTDYYGIPLLFFTNGDSRTSIDGVRFFETGNGTNPRAFSTMFKTGIFEAVWILTPERFHTGGPCLGSESLAQEIAKLLNWFRGDLKRRNHASDFLCYVSITNAKSVYFACETIQYQIANFGFDRDLLAFDRVSLQETDDVKSCLNSLLSQVWHAAGYRKAPTYGNDGRRAQV